MIDVDERRICISGTELNLLLMLYDAVPGFGPDHWLGPRQVEEAVGVRYAANKRDFSFLSEHRLLVVDVREPAARAAALEAEMERLNADWQKACRESAFRPSHERFDQERTAIEARIREVPEAVIYVTGRGANYVRLLRVKVAQISASSEAQDRMQGRRPCGLKEIPESQDGAFLSTVLRVSRELMLDLAGKVLASLIVGG